MTDPDVRDAIMRATYDALCEHGYTDLTAQDIADRTDKSKSLLFYHYDSKEDLVADFVDYLVDWFDERFAETDDRPPVEQLATFVDWFLYGSADDDERQSFHTAMLEIRTQAPYNEQYREQLRKSDEHLREIVESILREGMETGEFTDHDPEETAALLIATLDGARIRQLTLDQDDYLGQVRSAMIARIFEDLLAEDTSFPTESFPGDEIRSRSDLAPESSRGGDAPSPADADTTTE
ncbi:TetR/AcrR family transcriptional regulator [Halobiforma nitratireducens]|uniref:TetR family transcriptional regulator n=1 Tax=Halobiforma nitratireducens JCM 10879 TaxID=1227454 RepID=M0LK49_9EURY|nr:TetR/AcrR family transcriptional regulator [Halobiforma nitratireducens]EMA32385.1 TetR family transcriptional regulator [Halobiforma nitratireducens JCM 10879]